MVPYLHSICNLAVFFEPVGKVILTQFGRKLSFVHIQTISANAKKKQLTKGNV